MCEMIDKDSIEGYQKLIEQHQRYIDEYQKRIAELRQQKERGLKCRN
jgi:cytochrome c peroxidase